MIELKSKEDIRLALEQERKAEGIQITEEEKRRRLAEPKIGETVDYYGKPVYVTHVDAELGVVLFQDKDRNCFMSRLW